MKLLIFFSSDIYPKGGMLDLVAEADSEEEANNIIQSLLTKNDDPLGVLSWWQIVDRETLQIIKKSEDE